jgi:hypothetical protein
MAMGATVNSRGGNTRSISMDDPAKLEDGMQFRLTYDGPLFATQRDSSPGQPARHMGNKHDIRLAIHWQLKELWRSYPSLNGSGENRPKILLAGPTGPFTEPVIDPDKLAARHAMYGFNFVPLVTQELDLVCAIDILFLRPDRPGSVVWAGDIDNRLKTLLDAFRLPEAAEGYSQRKPGKGEMPLYCLLEDDKLISKVAVETDRLLQPLTGKNSIDAHDARLVITVSLRPYELHLWNIHFG